MANIQEIIANPKFNALSEGAKKKVLDKLSNGSFGKLSLGAQNKILKPAGEPVDPFKFTREEVSVTPEFSAKEKFIRKPPNPILNFLRGAQRDVVSPALQAGGGALGAIAGAASPIPGGAAIGGALGTGIGTELSNIAESALGIQELPTTPTEVAQRGIESLQTGLQEEIGGGVLSGIAGAGGAIARKISKRLTPQVKKAFEAAKRLELKDVIPISFNEAFPDSRIASIARTATDISSLSKFKLLTNKQKVDQQVETFIEDFVNKLSDQSDSTVVGQLFKDVRDKNIDIATAIESKTFEKIKKTIIEKTGTREVFSLDAAGNSIIEKLEDLGVDLVTDPSFAAFHKARQRGNLSFEQIKFLRANIRDNADALSKAGDKSKARIARIIEESLTKTMGETIQAVDSQAFKEWNFANSLTRGKATEFTFKTRKEMNDVLLSKLIKNASKKGNSTIAAEIFKTPEMINRAKAAVLGLDIDEQALKVAAPQLKKAFKNKDFKALQSAFLKDKINLFRKQPSNELNVTALSKWLKNPRNKEFLNAGFEKRTLKDMENLTDFLAVKQSAGEKGALNFIIPAAQATAAGAFFTGRVGLGQLILTVSLVPEAVGLLFTNPTLNRAFTQGVKESLVKKEVSKSLGRTISLLNSMTKQNRKTTIDKIRNTVIPKPQPKQQAPPPNILEQQLRALPGLQRTPS